MFGVELHMHLSSRQRHPALALCRVVAAPVLPDLGGCGVQRQGGHRGVADLVLHARDVENLLGNAGQALGVLLHHQTQAFLCGLLQVFFQQGIRLHDGRQWVANFMRHGGRHAAHGCQFFGAQTGFHFAQIVQKHHTQAGARHTGSALFWRGQPGAHVQTHRASPFAQQVYVARLGLVQAEGPACQGHQRLPRRRLVQGERRS